MVRSFYSGPCRWYAGGPVGRIRYYRANPGAKLLEGLNVFWPITELLSEETNTEGPGEVIPPPRRVYYKGMIFRPELDGTAPAGSQDDFAGRSPCPSVQPADPTCAAGDGARFVLQLAAADLAGAGDFAPEGLTVRLDDEPDLPLLWLRYTELAALPDGSTLDSWPPVPGTPRQGIPWTPANAATVLTDGATGLKGAQLNNGWPPGPMLSMLTWDTLTLQDWTILVALRPGPHPSGFYLTNPAGADAPLVVTPQSVFALSAAVGGLGLAAATGTEGVLDFWASQRSGETWSIWKNGALVLEGNGGALPVTLGFITGASEHLSVGYGWVPEVIIWGRALTAPELAAAFNRVSSFYHEDTDVIPSGTLMPFAGAALPAGYLACDGAAVSRSTYAALFAALGSTWGPGDGTTTFNLPDLRGRSPVGTSPGGLGADRPTVRALAAAGGEEAHTLTQGELPNVNFGVTDPGHAHGTLSGSDFDGQNGNTAGASAGNPGGDSGANQTGNAVTGVGVQSGGTDTPHNTMQPFAVVQWVIKT